MTHNELGPAKAKATIWTQTEKRSLNYFPKDDVWYFLDNKQVKSMATWEKSAQELN